MELLPEFPRLANPCVWSIVQISIAQFFENPNMPRPKKFCFLAALACGGLLFAQAHAENIAGQVIGVIDGDIVTLQVMHQQQHQIRIAGIDAPELAQDFGQQARASLSRLRLTNNPRQIAKNQTLIRSRFALLPSAVKI